MQLPGEFAVRQAIDKRHDHQPPALRIEQAQAAVERGALGTSDELGQCVGCFIGTFFWLVAGDFPRATADNIQGAIASEGDQEGLGAAARGVEPVRLLPDLDEGIVGRIGGERALPGDAQRDAVQARSPPIIQGPERRAVAIAATQQQTRRVVGGRRRCPRWRVVQHGDGLDIAILTIRRTMWNGCMGGGLDRGSAKANRRRKPARRPGCS